MNIAHAISQDHLDALLAGGGDAAAVRVLADIQLSRRLLMLRKLLDAAYDRVPDAARTAHLRSNMETLSSLDLCVRPAVHDVLRYPYVGSWAMFCLQELARPFDAAPLLPLHLGHLGSVALAVALRTGTPVEVHVPLAGGRVQVPGLGSFAVRPELSDRMITVCYDGGNQLVADTGAGRVELSPGPCRSDGGWRALRTLRARQHGLEIHIVLDDGDPYRRCFQPHVLPRVGDDEALVWNDVLNSAWKILVTRHRDVAACMATGTRVITPMERPLGAADTSTTSRYSVGAVAMSRPREGLRMAAALIHEFQHIKLHSVLEVTELVAPGPDAVFCSPWRQDPRPIHGVLHGVYAWLGVEAFWRAEAQEDPGDPLLTFEWCRSRELLREGARVLAGSGLVTAAGQSVLDAARAVFASDVPEVIPAAVTRRCEDLIADHRLLWRLRHLVPPDPGVDRLVLQYVTGSVPGPVASSRLAPSTVEDGGSRTRLRRAADLALENGTAIGGSDLDDDPDLALLRGDYRPALVGYEELITGSPDDLEAWAGAYVAQLRLTNVQTWTAARPELARAVYGRLHARPDRPRPGEVIAWLASEGHQVASPVSR